MSGMLEKPSSEDEKLVMTILRISSSTFSMMVLESLEVLLQQELLAGSPNCTSLLQNVEIFVVVFSCCWTTRPLVADGSALTLSLIRLRAPANFCFQFSFESFIQKIAAQRWTPADKGGPIPLHPL